MRVLFSWIGFRDLNFIADQIKNENFYNVLQDAKTSSRQSGGNVSDSTEFSPIVNIVNYNLNKKTPFEKLILFCDIESKTLHNEVKKYFCRYIDTIEIIEVPVSNVHNYGDILSTAIKKWHEIKNLDEVDAFFNLSSGTTAMGAFLTVLGQARYAEKAKFIQVSQNKEEIQEFSVDFNLASFAVNETFRRIDQAAFGSIAGCSPEIEKAKRYAAKAAKTDCNVLIYGETGTGKELFAHAIHNASSRKNKVFKAINCAAIPPELADSILFGYAPGTFTGQLAKGKDGLFQETNGGTLFLDELEACPQEIQEKLLRALDSSGAKMTSRRFEQTGGGEKESDVRIIAATNEHLGEGDFRRDLLQRVSTLSITLAPLRERQGDTITLAKFLFEDVKKQLGDDFASKKLSESAINFIDSRAWYGNVRELKNVLTQAIVFSENDEITEDDFDKTLPLRTADFSGCGHEIDLGDGIDLKAVIKEETIKIQKKYVEKALLKKGGNKTQAAELLGIKYQTIDNWEKAWEKHDNE